MLVLMNHRIREYALLENSIRYDPSSATSLPGRFCLSNLDARAGAPRMARSSSIPGATRCSHNGREGTSGAFFETTDAGAGATYGLYRVPFYGPVPLSEKVKRHHTTPGTRVP